MSTPKRRVDINQGMDAVREYHRTEVDQRANLPRSVRAMAVRFSLEELTARAPGNSVEVRVPPLGVTQCVEGPRHTRGTPPNVVETDTATWLALTSGELTWDQARADGRVSASGNRADLSEWLPLFHRL